METSFEGFEFDGIRSTDMGLIVEHVNKPVAPTINNSRQSVPGMYGDINLGNDYGNKVFNISTTFSAYSDDELFNEIIHNLANYLIRDPSDGAEYEMIFGDEPDVVYYGIFTSVPEATQLVTLSNDSKIDLVFTCSDPKGYLPQETVTVDSQPFVFTPDGTGETYPVYSIVPKEDVYEAAVAYGDDSDEYIDVGAQLDPSEAGNVVDSNPVLVNDPCNTAATWANLTTPPFTMSTDIDGKFATGTNSISVEKNSTTGLYNYGTAKNHKAWFGPMWKHENLTDAVKNFKLTFRLHHTKNYSRAISKAEVYLMDSSGKRVGRIFIEDISKGASSILAIYLGSEGSEKQVYRGHGKIHNGKNKTENITIETKHKKKVITGKGKSKKTKTEVTYAKKVEHLTDYNNVGYFNNAFIQFDIVKVGTSCYVTATECNPKNGKLKSTKIINKKKVTVASDFDLLTVAFYAARYPITEDQINPETSKPYKTYNYGFNSITGYKVSEYLVGDDIDAKPQLIAHAGDTIILNSEDKHATLVTEAGTESLDKHISFGSSFPPIVGGQETTIAISPGYGEADVQIDYRPTYK